MSRGRSSIPATDGMTVVRRDPTRWKGEEGQGLWLAWVIMGGSWTWVESGFPPAREWGGWLGMGSEAGRLASGPFEGGRGRRAPHPNPLPGREKRKRGTGFLLLQEWRRGVGIVVGLGIMGGSWTWIEGGFPPAREWGGVVGMDSEAGRLASGPFEGETGGRLKGERMC